MKPLRWMLTLGSVVSSVLASQTGLASSIVEVTPQDLSDLRAEPVRELETEGNAAVLQVPDDDRGEHGGGHGEGKIGSGGGKQAPLARYHQQIGQR